jgi:hypothetical protein
MPTKHAPLPLHQVVAVLVAVVAVLIQVLAVEVAELVVVVLDLVEVAVLVLAVEVPVVAVVAPAVVVLVLLVEPVAEVVDVYDWLCIFYGGLLEHPCVAVCPRFALVRRIRRK